MNNRIKNIPFPGIENAYVIISSRKSDTGNMCRKNMSFFYDNGDIGAEWEPDFGPITIIYKCDQGHEEAIPHWFYDYYRGQGYWSQTAVESEGLSTAFLNGDYDYLFAVLKKWSER